MNESVPPFSFVSFSANSLLLIFALVGCWPLRGILEILLCVQRVGWCARVRFFYISEEKKCLENSYTNYYLTMTMSNIHRSTGCLEIV